MTQQKEPLVTNDICIHCGADKGLHHYETNQCPLNGIEEYRDGYKQKWMQTTYDNGALQKTIKELQSALTALQEELKEAREKAVAFYYFLGSQEFRAHFHFMSPQMNGSDVNYNKNVIRKAYDSDDFKTYFDNIKSQEGLK